MVNPSLLAVDANDHVKISLAVTHQARRESTVTTVLWPAPSHVGKQIALGIGRYWFCLIWGIAIGPERDFANSRSSTAQVALRPYRLDFQDYRSESLAWN